MPEGKNSSRSIAYWLLTGCVLIFLMVAIGGITRLTNSGLSMVEWNLFMGSVPPSSDADWNELFDKYKQYPEYQLVNFNITLDEFKSIFFWEYFHRMFGRLIGLVFIIPFLWFLFKKKISKALMPKLILILILGAFQGFLGWYMVKSGLVKDPDVSHYRLAMHLTTAFLTFAYTFWVALSLLYPNEQLSTNKNLNSIKRYLKVFMLVLLVQIVWGAYVAGMNAGKIYNTWPLMGDSWMPESVTAMTPLWMNFFENIAGVQFFHRYLAYAVIGLVVLIYFKSRKLKLELSQSKGINALLIVVSFQFLLGILTVIYAVPLSLGLLHQLGAFLLLGATVFALQRFTFSRLV
tara:strand:+ start:633 stop:1676 length:1044 start_codon:yes stop_codon:yes gene_type:complete